MNTRFKSILNQYLKKANMDILMNFIDSFQFNYLHILLVGMIFFVAGYSWRKRKVHAMQKTIYELERDILRLNEDLLYPRNEAPVFRIKHVSGSQKTMTT